MNCTFEFGDPEVKCLDKRKNIWLARFPNLDSNLYYEVIAGSEDRALTIGQQTIEAARKSLQTAEALVTSDKL